MVEHPDQELEVLVDLEVVELEEVVLKEQMELLTLVVEEVEAVDSQMSMEHLVVLVS